jgi:hypothetical protein
MKRKRRLVPDALGLEGLNSNSSNNKEEPSPSHATSVRSIFSLLSFLTGKR